MCLKKILGIDCLLRYDSFKKFLGGLDEVTNFS